MIDYLTKGATGYWDLIDADKIDPRLAPIAKLISWSSNYERESYTPLNLFLDLIGWTLEEFGELVFDSKKHNLVFGYLEMYYIGAAMVCYSERPDDVTIYIHKVLEADFNE